MKTSQSEFCRKAEPYPHEFPKKNLDSRFRARIAAEKERITDIMRMRASQLQCWLNRGRRSRSHGTR